MIINIKTLPCILLILLLTALQGFSQTDCGCSERSRMDSLALAAMRIDSITTRANFCRNVALHERNGGCAILMLSPYVASFDWGAHDTIDQAFAVAHRFLKNSGCHDTTYVDYYYTLGRAMAQRWMVDSMVQCGTELLRIGKDWDHKEATALGNLTVGYAYFYQNDYQSAQPFFSRLLRQFDDIKNEGLRAKAMLGAQKQFMFFTNWDLSMTAYYDTAAVLVNQALKIAQNLGLDADVCTAFMQKATLYTALEKYDLAIQALDSAAVFADPTQPLDQIPMIAVRRADILSRTGHTAEAIKHLEENLPLVSNENPSLRRIIWISIYHKAKHLGDYPKALAAHEEFKRLADSLFTEEKARSTREFEAKFHKAEQETQIKELSQAQEIKDLRIQQLIAAIAIAVVSALLMLMTLYLWYRRRLLRSRQALIEAEQRLNRSRINPHFFFNILTTLQGMALDPARAPNVPSYLARYARLMRITLESTYNEMIPLDLELKYLEDFLAIRRLQDPDLFDFEIEVDANLEPSDLQVPSLLLQPLAENAIEHGFKARGHGGFLHVAVTKNQHGLEIEVRDNGAEGPSQQNHKGFPSRANQILDDRIFLLNSQGRVRGKYEVQKHRVDQGYMVQVRIPIN